MKTNIIATIGPATLDFDVFSSLLTAGATHIRINTAYGDMQQYNLILQNLKNTGRTDIKIMFDIKNLNLIDYINEHKINIVAHSFTENASRLQELRTLTPHAFIVSKIESAQGVTNFEEILDASDGVMIARGDLGEAVSLEKVPCLQKKISKLSLKKGRYLIAATEMLLSMTNSPKPTRAEVSDVANAVFDGVDAVMLSEETAIGQYPVEAVTYMRKIIEEAEMCEWD